MKPKMEITIASKETLRNLTKSMDLNIVNNLNIIIECKVEVIGNRMTIWIMEKK